ncbi:ThiF family adenylyltransferase [Bradyrhizobium sp. CCGUVB1N3]|uniref:HesA/MoeB/ThiF family protein n=1 Tax=Bradyrhizobium sp. CCGUVB1N3 TaxID=2949629 RepID=UPI0020B37311|nr:ThiF family adenylyltransferase [Bradyrhizobium sp. CCGUVB1N3]MCP3473823.1 ThiF family adenylyltransferase [Bradyrhizobium sp. CCGUVB1N3]
MSDQRSMIRDAMQAIAQRKPGKSKLVYDKTKRTIVAVSEGVPTPQALNITADDADMFGVVTLSSGWLRDKWLSLTKAGSLPVDFSSWDDGDALTQLELCIQGSGTRAAAMLVLGQPQGQTTEGVVISIVPTDKPAHRSDVFVSPDNIAYRAELVEPAATAGRQREVVFADIEPQLDLRRAGILETTVLKDRTVLCIGLGTGGAHVAVELAKSGVGHFILVDRDRLSVGNVVRHPGGISQVGRAKVNVTRDLILEKNPGAQVEVHVIGVGFENRDVIAGLVQASDLVICGTDNRQSKLLINELCVSANKSAVYGGAFRRAYGGQILRVRPKLSPCQQCFVSSLPDEASDVEVSSQDDADAIAYSDRPVAVEPGLSLDVLPIATQLAKLAMLELLADKSSTLNVLKRDFDAPWYLWLNRPEPGTQYADMPPLSDSSDEMTINRWYGIYFERDEQCPVCGDFLSGIAAAYGLDATQLPALPEKE